VLNPKEGEAEGLRREVGVSRRDIEMGRKMLYQDVVQMRQRAERPEKVGYGQSS
jgi:hypothetical protein